MKNEALNGYERPESEVMIVVHEYSFLESVLESPTENPGGEIDINP